MMRITGVSLSRGDAITSISNELRAKCWAKHINRIEWSGHGPSPSLPPVNRAMSGPGVAGQRRSANASGAASHDPVA